MRPVHGFLSFLAVALAYAFAAGSGSVAKPSLLPIALISMVVARWCDARTWVRYGRTEADMLQRRGLGSVGLYTARR